MVLDPAIIVFINPFGAPSRGADGDELSFYLSDPQYYIEIQRYFS